MPRRPTGENVFDAAVNRMVALYEQGHRIVVSFSGGKDSGSCLEVCLIAARMTGRLPIDVIMRDEEIMFPGTFEYAERVAQRPEVSFHWIYACQPVINVFNREQPYFWTFDPLLSPDEWVRKPPERAYKIPGQHIEMMVTPERFPLAEGKDLFAVIGLRVSESRGRMYGLFSSKGYITKPHRYGVYNCRPIYDWQDGDVWKAHRDNHWDYNQAYDVMSRLGVPRHKLRIAPPTMSAAGAPWLGVAARAWPLWFEKVARRLPGVRSVARFGIKAVQPMRRFDETWEQCFHRTCVDEAPAWIRERALEAKRKLLSLHGHHAMTPLPEVNVCHQCAGRAGSWKALTLALYCGDPFSIRVSSLPYVEPEYFRPGAGTWGGSPNFA